MAPQPDYFRTLHGGPGSVLLVDADGAARSRSARHLSRLGYTVVQASNQAEMLDRLHRGTIAGVLLDPGPSVEGAFAMLTALLERDPTLAAIVVSERNEATVASECMRHGAVDYLTKPLDPSILERALERALTWRDRIVTDRETQKLLRAEVAERAEMIRQEREKLQLLAESSLQTLVSVMEAKDPCFAGHSLRVSQMGASIAAKMGRSDREVEQVRMAGRLHDLGMIAVSSDILAKAGPLTPEEFSDIKRHPLIGAQLLAPYSDLADIARFIRGHHERWDGAGYPDGLARQDISWGARVLCAAEIYDAMTSPRAYREKISQEESLLRMHALVGETLDPAVFEALAEVIHMRQALEFVESDHGSTSRPSLINLEITHAA